MTRFEQRSAYVAAVGLAVLGTVPGVAASEAPPPTCEGVEATIVGTSGPDRIVGTDERDVVWAGDGADEIHGLDGGDWICGGAGPDLIDAGPYVAGGHRDFVFGHAGDDRLVDLAADAFAFGGGGNDRLRGSTAPAPRPDPWGRLQGGPGDDRVVAGSSRAEMDGGPDDDLLEGSAAADRIAPGAGHDVVLAGGGDDWVVGWIGDGDALDGGDGADTVSYDFGGGPIRVNLVNGVASRMTGGPDGLVSVSHILGTRWADVLIGDAHDNVLRGRGGADLLLGRRGVDVMFGSAGGDYLDGGLPSGASDPDTARGGRGDDQCFDVGLRFGCGGT